MNGQSANADLLLFNKLQSLAEETAPKLGHPSEDVERIQYLQKKLQFQSQEAARQEPQVTTQIRKTNAQLKYDLIKRKRQVYRIEQKLKQTHRERMEKFNKKISKIPEHFDIPKVGPG